MGARFLHSAMQSVTYEDFDFPMGGFDVILEEMELKRYVHSEIEFQTEIKQMVNFVFSSMVANRYFDMFSLNRLSTAPRSRVSEMLDV